MSADKLDTTSGTPGRKFIAGVYNHCDHWCERCRFQPRCRLYRDMERYRAAAGEGRQALDAVPDELDELDAIERENEDVSVTPSQRAEFLAFLEEVNKPAPPDELARIMAVEERRRAQQEAHPLTVAAREYADIAGSVITALRPLLNERGDPLVLAALETIDRFAYFLAVKTWRAIGGLVSSRHPGLSDEDDDDDDDNGPQEVQSDANGCAKLVRLVIAESREAWQVLMQVGLATADGVPAAMVRRLSELDAGLGIAFPRAMEFVRPGFDDGG